MRTLRIYLPSLVLLAWAAVVWAIGRSDALVIAGLVITAVAMWICIRELADHYKKQGNRDRHRHP